MKAACKFGCCTPEVAALPDGGWSADGLVLDDRRREHVRRERAAEFARIDQMHAAIYRACAVCGQLAIRLDTFGLCSKNTETHKARRGGLTFAPAGRRR
ncbi:hypothetical protein [Microbacterium thalli]|uniref:4Fe-4S Wbl-type domain-containing protein n=1 Tax=Microbacterium thalli TaxID=3027921 RepID=A0ABT5SKH6_9MICO|nr:hypothetical protein [Microbacterium thalli]MDD7963330.1 hypothetical protein [Microbacterium thalli]